MCGVFFTNFKIDSVLDRVHSSLSLRGPDGIYTQREDDFFIQFTRLAIRDVGGGKQPYVTQNNGFICAINGELYNEDEIRRKFESFNGHAPSGDMQLLGEFLSQDINNLSQVQGMFAGFIYSINKKEIFLFRDPVGEKPLYYFIHDEFITVSSTISAIVDKHGKVNFTLNRKDLYKGHQRPGETIFVEIKELLPGERVHFDIKNKSLSGVRFWKWPERNTLETNNIDVKLFDSAISQAVTSTSISDVPICMLLSGGLDSAAILSSLNDNSDVKVPSFTLAFENYTFDESRFAAITAKSLKSKHHVFRLSNKEFASHLSKQLDVLDSPILDPAYLPMSLLTKRISNDFGYKVAITGDGGDELFRGYELFGLRNRLNIVSGFPINILMLTFIGIVKPFLAEKDTRNSWEFLIRRLESVLKNSNLPWYEIALSPFAGTNILNKLLKDTDLKKADNCISNKVTSEQIEKYYNNEILPQVYLKKADNGSMANGMEIRIPFLHKSMIEFGFTIAGNELDRKSQKWLIKEFLKEKIPSEVLSQRKHGFSVPLSEILSLMPKPKWSLDSINLSSGICDHIWQKACSGQANAARAAYGLLVLNSYLQK